MRTVECKLDENEFKNITEEAKRLGVYRSDLIRSKLTSAPAATPLAVDGSQPLAFSSGMVTAADYMNIVAALRKRMGNSIGRAQAEQATAIVIKCLHG